MISYYEPPDDKPVDDIDDADDDTRHPSPTEPDDYWFRDSEVDM